MKKQPKSLKVSRETLQLLESGALRGAPGQISGPCTTTNLTSCQVNSYVTYCVTQTICI